MAYPQIYAVKVNKPTMAKTSGEQDDGAEGVNQHKIMEGAHNDGDATRTTANNITDNCAGSEEGHMMHAPEERTDRHPAYEEPTGDTAGAQSSLPTSYSDDAVTSTWSLDSDGRPVSMPHSWHPSSSSSAPPAAAPSCCRSALS